MAAKTKTRKKRKRKNGKRRRKGKTKKRGKGGGNGSEREKKREEGRRMGEGEKMGGKRSTAHAKAPPFLAGCLSVHHSIFRNFSFGFFFLISFAHSSHTGRIHPVV